MVYVPPVDSVMFPSDLFEKHLTGRHDQSTHAHNGKLTGLSTVADKLNEKSKLVKENGGKIERLTTIEQQDSDYQQLLVMGEQVAQGVDPDGGMSAEDGIAFDNGYQMTKDALTWKNPTAISDDEEHLVTLHDKDGNLAGASVIYEDANYNGEPIATLGYVGTTGYMDGAGSALYADSLKWASKKGLGIQLQPLDSDARSFWEAMGFQSNVEDKIYLYMDSTEVAEIAGKLNA